MAIVFLDGYETGIIQPTGSTNTGGLTAALGRDGVGQAVRCGSGGDYIAHAFVSGSDTIYFHTAAQIVSSSAWNVTNGGADIFMVLTDAGTVAHLTANISTAGAITLRAGGSAGTIIQTSSKVFPTGTAWRSFEVKATIHDTSGECVIKVDGVEWINFSGDTRGAGSSTRPDRIRVGAGNPGMQYRDDFLVCDTTGSANNSWTGEVAIVGLRANGNGASSGLLGSDANSVDNYLLVDEYPLNSTDYAGAATPGAWDSYAMSNVGKVGTVLGVQQFSYAAKNDSGAKGFKHVCRASSGTLSKSAEIPLSTSYLVYSGPILQTDPDGAPWTVAAVDAAEFGFEVGA